jgi:hypothetical protein
MYLSKVVSYGLVVVAKELDEDSVGVAKEHSGFAGVGFPFVLLPHHKSALQLMVDHHACLAQRYLSILSFSEVFTKLISKFRALCQV